MHMCIVVSCFFEETCCIFSWNGNGPGFFYVVCPVCSVLLINLKPQCHHDLLFPHVSITVFSFFKSQTPVEPAKKSKTSRTEQQQPQEE